jgi:hypothetical protein
LKEQLKAWAKRLAPFLLVALVAFAGGFWSARRGPTPDKVTETSLLRDNYHGEDKTEVKAAEKLDEKVATAKRRVVRRRTFRPDGTLRSETTSIAETGTVAETNRSTEVAADESKKTDETLRLDTKRETIFRRDWYGGVLLGAELQNPITAGGNPFGTLSVGLEGKRRLNFIPIPGADRAWLGLSLTMDPMRIAASEDRFKTFRLYVSLGVEF